MEKEELIEIVIKKLEEKEGHRDKTILSLMMDCEMDQGLMIAMAKYGKEVSEAMKESEKVILN